MNVTIGHIDWRVAVAVAALAAFGLYRVLGLSREWVTDRYETTVSLRGGLHVARRWYGAAAQVIRRDQVEAEDPDRFAVIDWWQDGPADGGALAGTWLWVARLDPDYMTYWDEDAEPFWAPVTDFAPYAVRRVRPHFWRFGRIPLPRLTSWVLLPAFLDGGA